MIEVRVPATSGNLGPGFDSFGMALDLWNIFRFEVGKAWDFRLDGPEGSPMPDGASLIAQGARAVASLLGQDLPPLAVHATAHVPPAKGLGSSATAVLAGVLAADRLLGGGLGPRDLLRAAAGVEGHPDNVGAALLGGIVLVVKRSEGALEPVTLPVPEGVRALLVEAGGSLPTPRSRAALPERVPLEDAVFNISRASLLTAALLLGRLDLLAEAFQDRCHQPYRASLVPGLGHLLAAPVEAGALGAFLSGAGPAVLALVREGEEKAVARAIRSNLGERGVRVTTRLMGLSKRGAEVSGEG